MTKEILSSENQVKEWIQILDLTQNDPRTTKLRDEARKSGRFLEEQILVDENKQIVARRIDYENGSYFAYLTGFDNENQSLFEPTVDDVPENIREKAYQLRWEFVNNPVIVSVDYMGIGCDVESEILAMPDGYGSATLVDNHELRRLAIEQGAFRPFVSKH